MIDTVDRTLGSWLGWGV